MDTKAKTIMEVLALYHDQIALAMIAVGDAGKCVEMRICLGREISDFTIITIHEEIIGANVNL